MSLTKRWMDAQAEVTPLSRLEAARAHVREALRVAADETPSYALLDDLSRSLIAAGRELEHLHLQLAVAARREERQVA